MNSNSLFIIFAAILLFSACGSQSEPEKREVVFTVGGMYCESCVSAVTNEMNRIDGVSDVNVTLTDSTVVFSAPDNKMPDQERIKRSIEALGYTVHFSNDTE